MIHLNVHESGFDHAIQCLVTGRLLWDGLREPAENVNQAFKRVEMGDTDRKVRDEYFEQLRDVGERLKKEVTRRATAAFDEFEAGLTAWDTVQSGQLANGDYEIIKSGIATGDELTALYAKYVNNAAMRRVIYPAARAAGVAPEALATDYEAWREYAAAARKHVMSAAAGLTADVPPYDLMFLTNADAMNQLRHACGVISNCPNVYSLEREPFEPLVKELYGKAVTDEFLKAETWVKLLMKRM